MRISLLMLIICGLAQAGGLRIVTTTEDLASLTRAVGGEQVEVLALAQRGQDPHFLEAKPSYMVKVNRADLVIAVGLDLESGWLPPLLRGARNAKVQPGNPGFLDASTAITPIEVNSQVDRSQGDAHPHGNPHYLVDPERGLAVAKAIANRLGELDPEHRQIFSVKFEAFRSVLTKKIAEWKKAFLKLKAVPVIGYHGTFNYLFSYLGFKVVGFIEPKPGIPPSPKHIAYLMNLAKKTHVRLVVVEDFFNPKSGPEEIAKAASAKVVLLPAYSGSMDGATDYLSWLNHLYTKISAALNP